MNIALVNRLILCLFLAGIVYVGRKSTYTHPSSRIGIQLQIYYYRARARLGSLFAFRSRQYEQPTVHFGRIAGWTDFDVDNYIKYSNFISRAAFENNLDPDLIRAVIIVESKFIDRATSPRGASGLMQLMPETAKEVGVIDVLDPSQNIGGGSRYLRRMLNRFNGDMKMALAAYNAGPGAVEEHNGIPPFAETHDYVSKVLTAYQLIRES